MTSITRYSMLSLAAVAIGIALSTVCRSETQGAGAPPPRGPLRERPLQEITPIKEFFVVQSAETPKIDAGTWRLSVGGMVRKHLSLSLEEIGAMKQVEEVVTIECIENPPGGGLIGTGRWGGVLLEDILRKAEVEGTPRTIVFRAADGYEESIPYEFLKRSPVMLATTLNGKPLPPEQGLPARLIVPGLYGVKQVKWVRSIESLQGDFRGFWARRGWSDKAEASVKSWIYRVDRYSKEATDLVIKGVAFAGLRPVAKVELTLDGGLTWKEAAIDKVVSPYAWSIWSFRWPSPSKGTYRIAVRATDPAGNTQPVVDDNYRDGNNGIHSVTYEVRD